jgi:hypothetical protein
MAEYLLLFRGGDSARAEEQQSPEKWQAHMQKWMQWMGDLTAQQKFVGAQPLKVDGRVVNGSKKLVTDGPFVEGKEMVGGYLICKADSLEEAVEISKGCPVLEHEGLVEVREINELHPS